MMSHVLLLPITCEPLVLPVELAILVGYALLTIMSPFAASVQTLFSSGLTALVITTQAEPADHGSNVGSANEMGASSAA